MYTVNYKSLHFRGPFLLAFKILLILNMSSTRVLVTFVTLLLMSSSANAQTSNENDEGSDPWKTPLQELEAIAPRCIMKIPEFGQLAFKAQDKWQSCINSFSPKFQELEPRNGMQEDSKINSSVIYEIDKQLHMAICRNTSAYKQCWSGIIHALNECELGSGNVSGKLYFALYDDICREGGQITVENRRKAATEGKLCERDYSTEICRIQRENMKANNLCLRFQSNVACDLSSIDPNCQNKVDKGLHAEIFQRVEKVLGCSSFTTSSHSATSTLGNKRSTIYTFFQLITLYSFLTLYETRTMT